MVDLQLRTRVRPISLAIIMETGDDLSLRDVFQFYSSLWGGPLNSILILDSKIDISDSGEFTENANRKIAQHFKLFIPDVVLFGNDRLRDNCPPIGAIAFEHTASKGFRLWHTVSSVPVERMIPRTTDSIIVSASTEASDLIVALYGTLPDRGKSGNPFPQFRISETDSFIGVSDGINVETILDISLSGIKCTPHGSNDDIPNVIVIDPNHDDDLALFWNIRALYPGLVVLNGVEGETNSVNDWSQTISQYMSDGSINTFTRFEVSKRISKTKPKLASAIRSTISALDPYSSCAVHVSKPLEERQGVAKTTASYRTESFYVKNDSIDTLEFPAPQVEFSNFPLPGDHWALVHTVSDAVLTSNLALSFPTHLTGLDNTFGVLGSPSFRTREGVVTLANNATSEVSIKLPSRQDIVQHIASAAELKVSYSRSGKLVDAVIARLGGLSGLWLLKNEDIVKELEKIARSELKGLPTQQFENRFKSKDGAPIWKAMVENGVVELGVKVPCDLCNSYNWFDLSSVSYNLECSVCLGKFKFPTTSVNKNAEWTYKLKGPFALDDYGKGSFSVALTLRHLRLFASISRNHHTTWMPGVELKSSRGDHYEADCFMLSEFVNDRNHLPSEPMLVFAECKSFGANGFQTADFERMKALATRFPHSTIVFATMKNPSEISAKERAHLSRFARWSETRISRRDHRKKALLVLLTADELFSPRNDQYAAFEVSNSSSFESHFACLSRFTRQKYSLP